MEHEKHKAALSHYSRRSGHSVSYHDAEAPQSMGRNQKISEPKNKVMEKDIRKENSYAE